jgi:secondary thiamine-phosphate synthase enzyme
MNRKLEIQVRRRGLHDITSHVAEVVAASGVTDGLCTVFLQHTSASLLINEGADPSVKRDLEAWLARLVPDGDELFTHTAEGPDDMPSHVKAALTQTSIAIPVLDGRLALGTWQALLLWEHRKYRSKRKVIVHVGP